MTLEELRAEAKKHGYYIIQRKHEKILPCVCGSKRREHHYSYKDGKHNYFLTCNKCGRSVKGYSEEDVKHQWNLMIEKERENA